jgi:hypothetical protein
MPITAGTARRAALLTCVTNGGGIGPGHSAVVVDGFVYTFERFLAGWVTTTASGWLQVRTRDYLDQNRHRPVIVQELAPTKTNATAILKYIASTDAADADYLSSGLCSHLAARSLSAGLPIKVNPWGWNFPFQVYHFLKHTRLVSDSYCAFPDGIFYGDFNGRNLQLYNLYYPESQRQPENPGILAW